MVPDPASWRTPPDAAYLHYVSNETIGGVQFPYIPDSTDAAGVRYVVGYSVARGGRVALWA